MSRVSWRIDVLLTCTVCLKGQYKKSEIMTKGRIFRDMINLKRQGFQPWEYHPQPELAYIHMYPGSVVNNPRVKLGN